MTDGECHWASPTEQPRLARGLVHVWCLPLDLADASIEDLHATLSPDESERAARFLFDRHRRRFIACRGQVREIIAAYLNERPQHVCFRYGSAGKPALDAPWNDSGITFNISNSHELAICALAIDRELGVDIEHIREPRDFDGLAAQFFARAEVDSLQSLLPEERLEAFFNCWTRKEAVLKAVGTGLSFPLDRVIVTVAPNELPSVLSYDGNAAAPVEWWLHCIDPAPGYIGALASPGSPLQAIYWRWHTRASRD
ncbi:MAG TPA: 4'-phosphopantetheinyl transferase superfamily protein [Planctomycetaceae bacterium]|nr:4'-phosphopantetheinyl transferase superfamily protein [Planctomycetaceae bacterium]